jgi:hypothetical protein
MAAAPDNGMLRPPGPAPLGAILVQRGVLTEEQLAIALDEQKRTGEQIGEVIVRLGLALASSVAQALATQHGSLLKTEYGYAVGFGGPTPPASADPPPVSPALALKSPATAPAASALRVAESPEVAPTPTPVSAPAATAAAVPTPSDPNLVQWQQYAQRLTAERDAALQQAQVLAAERDAASTDLDAMKARAAELETTTARLTTELETLSRNRNADMQRVAELMQRLEEAKTARVQAVELEAAQAEHIRAPDESVQCVGDLKQQLDELQSTASRVVELEATTALAEVERARLTRARDDAARRSTELAHQNAELGRQVAELEAAESARESELGTALVSTREEAERIMLEKAALEAVRESLAGRNADLEKQLEAADADMTRLGQLAEQAAAQITQLEAERNDALAVTKARGEDRRGRHPGEHAEDSAHLLFIPGADGYRLLEQEGPPPAPGSTLEFGEDDGTRSRLLVAKVGAAPLPGVRLACAYLVVAA